LQSIALNSFPLYISFNNIGDEGAKALAQNKTITAINILDNDIGDEGTKELKGLNEKRKIHVDNICKIIDKYIIKDIKIHILHHYIYNELKLIL
jgi:hypothetical protein